MKKIILFLKTLINTINQNELMSFANELTYQLVFALFPFLMFMLTLLSFFDINIEYFMSTVGSVFPDDVMRIIDIFFDDISNNRSVGVLSLSFLMSGFSTSRGILAIMKGVNKAYLQKETRGFIKLNLISFYMVGLLSTAILLSVFILVFGNMIINLVSNYMAISVGIKTMINIISKLVVAVIVFLLIMLIYKYASSKKEKLISLVPGASLSLMVWVLISLFFNMYISNFTKYSNVYGSLAGVIILMFWLNLISIALIVGAAVNAVLGKKDYSLK